MEYNGVRFTHLFSIPKYRKEMYLCLHPEDRGIKEKDLKDYTISSILTNIQVNDLGILVGNILLILFEAQSIWTLNILPRTMGYLWESYINYLIDTNQNIYGTKKVKLPRPELYVIYTGKKKIDKKTISFKKEFFDGVDCPIDIEIKVITLDNASKIIKEYIKFSSIVDKNNKKYGYSKKSIMTSIDYCIKHNILKEYLSENKKEVYNVMYSVLDQSTATEMYGRERYATGEANGIKKGRVEGRAEGKLEGRINAFISMLQQGLISEEVVMSNLKLSKEELRNKIKEFDS